MSFPVGRRRVHLGVVGSPSSSSRVSLDEAIRALSAHAQVGHGVVSTAAADRLAPGRWRRFVELGWLRRAGPGVLVVAGSPASWEQDLVVALTALGPEAWVSHRSAAALHRLDRSVRGAAHVSVPRELRGRGRRLARTGGVVLHSTGTVGPNDIVVIGGLRATSATRTIIDLANIRAPRAEIEASIDSAVRGGLSAPIVLERRLGELRGRGRWGCRLLDDLLVDSGGHTMLERRFLRLVRRAGLPRPRRQLVHRRGSRTVARVDFCYDELDLVIEVSGSHGHSSPTERAIDAQRRNELQELGRTVLEYTWNQVTGSPDQVSAGLERALRRAGWHP